MSIIVLGNKLGMTKLFQDNGDVIPVTAIKLEPAVVLSKKTIENDGYQALQFGFVDAKDKLVKKPQKEFFKKHNLPFKKYFKESKVDLELFEKYNVGDSLEIDFIEKGAHVDVTAQSIGKGFAGGIKRWAFYGGRKSHGSMFHRAPGSIGASADPSRVLKGKKMPGHLGASRATVQNLLVVDYVKEENLVFVKGAIPGSKGAVVQLRKAKKKAS